MPWTLQAIWPPASASIGISLCHFAAAPLHGGGFGPLHFPSHAASQRAASLHAACPPPPATSYEPWPVPPAAVGGAGAPSCLAACRSLHPAQTLFTALGCRAPACVSRSLSLPLSCLPLVPSLSPSLATLLSAPSSCGLFPAALPSFSNRCAQHESFDAPLVQLVSRMHAPSDGRGRWCGFC